MNFYFLLPILFAGISACSQTPLKDKENKLTIEQYMKCVEEIYIQSLQKDPSKVDEEFGEWWIDLATD